MVIDNSNLSVWKRRPAPHFWKMSYFHDFNEKAKNESDVSAVGTKPNDLWVML